MARQPQTPSSWQVAGRLGTSYYDPSLRRRRAREARFRCSSSSRPTNARAGLNTALVLRGKTRTIEFRANLPRPHGEPRTIGASASTNSFTRQSSSSRRRPSAPLRTAEIPCDSGELPAESHQVPARSRVFALSLRNCRSLTYWTVRCATATNMPSLPIIFLRRNLGVAAI